MCAKNVIIVLLNELKSVTDCMSRCNVLKPFIMEIKFTSKKYNLNILLLKRRSKSKRGEVLGSDSEHSSVQMWCWPPMIDSSHSFVCL